MPTGRASESVGEEAAASLVTDIQSGGCVDSYLQDQVPIIVVVVMHFIHIPYEMAGFAYEV